MGSIHFSPLINQSTTIFSSPVFNILNRRHCSFMFVFVYKVISKMIKSKNIDILDKAAAH